MNEFIGVATVLDRLICLGIGYACGLFQTAYIIGRLNHIDIREHGSGNAGTTNALRILGKKAAIMTYLGDAVKALVAAAIVYFIFKNAHSGVESVSQAVNYHYELIKVLLMYCGLGVVLGHNFPFYLGFKGGKGIATSSGIIMAFDWKLGIIAIITFIIITALTRYVSLASIVMMVGFFIELVILCNNKLAGNSLYNFQTSSKYDLYIVAFILTAMAAIRHRANIIRLMNGTEDKLGQKREK